MKKKQYGLIGGAALIAFLAGIGANMFRGWASGDAMSRVNQKLASDETALASLTTQLKDQPAPAPRPVSAPARASPVAQPRRKSPVTLPAQDSSPLPQAQSPPQSLSLASPSPSASPPFSPPAVISAPTSAQVVVPPVATSSAQVISSATTPSAPTPSASSIAYQVYQLLTQSTTSAAASTASASQMQTQVASSALSVSTSSVVAIATSTRTSSLNGTSTATSSASAALGNNLLGQLYSGIASIASETIQNGISVVGKIEQGLIPLITAWILK